MFHSVCFVNTDFRSLTITCIIYTCYKCLACESKMASILNLIVGSSVGCPLNCPLFPYLKVVGYPLSCLLSCPLYPYMAVVGSLICMAKFPWAAHEQPTPLPTELPTFFMFGSSGLPTELPPVSIYGSSGQPNLHGKILMGSPWAAHSVVHVQPMGSEVGSSPVFSVWVASIFGIVLSTSGRISNFWISAVIKRNISIIDRDSPIHFRGPIEK